MSWRRNETFQSKHLVQDEDSSVHQPGNDHATHEHWKPVDYFNQYIGDDVYKMLADATNQTDILLHGNSLKTSSDEIRKFIGINILMGSLRYPRIRMYWKKSTGGAAIKKVMSRDRFLKLQSNLKVVVDINVSDEVKEGDKLWKVRPLLKKINDVCLTRPRPQHCCIDEQTIPFTGRVSVRQYVCWEPYPTGLKNFVLASPSGEVLDFEIFQGKNFFPDAENYKISVGGLAVL
jgi:hypothetical protein